MMAHCTDDGTMHDMSFRQLVCDVSKAVCKCCSACAAARCCRMAHSVRARDSSRVISSAGGMRVTDLTFADMVLARGHELC